MEYGLDFLTGIDFAPEGTRIATMDGYGICLVSDVDSDDYLFHVELISGGSSNMFHFPIAPSTCLI